MFWQYQFCPEQYRYAKLMRYKLKGQTKYHCEQMNPNQRKTTMVVHLSLYWYAMTGPRCRSTLGQRSSRESVMKMIIDLNCVNRSLGRNE